MTNKEMKRLGRADLLRIIVKQQEKIEKLEKENKDLKNQLDSRILICQKAGSLAQAAAQISGLFEAAQKTADQYLESLKAMTENSEARELSNE